MSSVEEELVVHEPEKVAEAEEVGEADENPDYRIQF